MVQPHFESDVFDTVAGLPLHPLVVHVAVVILPLSAIALVLIVLIPRWRGALGWVTMAGLAVGAGAAFVAKETGEALAARVGLPQRHADLGDRLPLVAVITLLIALAWFLLDRQRRREGGPRALVTVLAVASIVAAAATTVLTVLVGHSGAEAVWSGRITASATGSGTTPRPAAPGSTGQEGTYTLADVASHSTPSDCWTVVEGTVYDVTAWIDRHPGGAASIESMCGIDATAAFTGQHDGQRRPAEELATFAIGTLRSSVAEGAGGGGLLIAQTSSVTAPSAKRYTRAQVRRHATPTDCWTIIGGSVYNLTGWISRHPGGSGPIISLCGRDGTAAFTAKHGGQGAPQAALAQFRIGRLTSASRA